MKKICFVFILFVFTIPKVVYTQDNKVRFETELTWSQVKAKAKKLNKYIFVDCYATWCMPCKKMEKEVFVNDSVRSILNERFISMEVQMDTSKFDTENIKKRYNDAVEIRKLYKINVLPTFLFFSPEGEFIHRDGGYKDTQGFISLIKDALNPEKQFYTLLNFYEKGVKDYANMPYLANLAGYHEDMGFAKKIALDYINNYLLNQNKKTIYSNENIFFYNNVCK